MFSFFKKFLKKDVPKSEYIPKEEKQNSHKITISINTSIEINPIYQKPLKCGLLPGEIVLIDWLENKSSAREYPKYYDSTYDINAAEKTQNLIEKGYVRIASPKEGLHSLRATDLAEILEYHKLKKTGKKQELIDRLCEALSSEEINEYIEDRVYVITEKGKSTLEEYYYILFAHRHSANLYSVSEAIAFMQDRADQPSNLEIGTLVLKSRLRENIESGNYGLARNCFSGLARLNDIHKQDKDTVFFYLCMFIFDVSGWGNSGDYHENNTSETFAEIAPRLIGNKMDESTLRADFDKAWESVEIAFPKHYLGKEKSYECLVAGFNKDTETIRRLLNLDNRKERDYSSYKF